MAKTKQPRRIIAKHHGKGYRMTEEGKIAHKAVTTFLDSGAYLDKKNESLVADIMREFSYGIHYALQTGRIANIRITFDILEK
jgi:hypothetical protein